MLTLLTPLLLLASAHADERLKLRDVRVEATGQAAQVGTYTVFEDREAGVGRTLDLDVLILRATGEDPRPDPIFYLAGGPGQAAAQLYEGFVGSWMNEDRDIVLVSQRGTGGMNRLDCAVVGNDGDIQTYLDVLFTPEAFASCVERLSATADLTKYTTPIAMDDLDEIRMALGYDRINLIGGSYGTRASLVYMRRHAATVRSAILTGVAPIAFTNPLYHAAGGQRALDMVLDACDFDPECAAAFPDLRRKLDTVLQRLDEKPARATVTHPVTGEPVQVDLSRDAFAGALRLMMYYGSREIPSLLNRAFEGDLDAFAQHAMQRSRAIRNALAFGMLLCVTCNEDIPRIDHDDIDRLTAGTFLGDGRVRRQMAVCEIWPRGGVPEDYGEPVRVNVPTLIISGEYDPVTPPSWGDYVARNLSDSRHVVVPGAAHGPGGPCVEAIMRTFLDTRRVEDRDLDCLKPLRLPRFNLDEP